MANQPYVVVLTGGYQPGDEDNPPEPHQNDIGLALDRSGFLKDPGNTLVRRIVAEAFKVGFHQAAMLGRVVAVYVLPDKGEAERFAAFMSRVVDPAYARQAGDPDAEYRHAAGEVT